MEEAARQGGFESVLPAQRLLDAVQHGAPDQLPELGVGTGGRSRCPPRIEWGRHTELVRAGSGRNRGRLPAGRRQLRQRRRLRLGHGCDRAHLGGGRERTVHEQDGVDGPVPRRRFGLLDVCGGGRLHPPPAAVRRFQPVRRVARASRVAGDARGHEGIHRQVFEAGLAVNGVRHVGGGSHHGGPVRRGAHFGAYRAVVLRLSERRDPVVARGIAGGLAALVVGQERQVLALAAVLGGGAEDAVGRQQLDQQKASRAAGDEQLAVVQRLGGSLPLDRRHARVTARRSGPNPSCDAVLYCQPIVLLPMIPGSG